MNRPSLSPQSSQVILDLRHAVAGPPCGRRSGGDATTLWFHQDADPIRAKATQVKSRNPDSTPGY